MKLGNGNVVNLNDGGEQLKISQDIVANISPTYQTVSTSECYVGFNFSLGLSNVPSGISSFHAVMVTNCYIDMTLGSHKSRAYMAVGIYTDNLPATRQEVANATILTMSHEPYVIQKLGGSGLGSYIALTAQVLFIGI